MPARSLQPLPVTPAVSRAAGDASRRPGSRSTSVRPSRAHVAGLILSLAFLATPVRALDSSTPVPDFKLVDINPNSPRYGKTTSPRDYRLQIAAYYFGDAG